MPTFMKKRLRIGTIKKAKRFEGKIGYTPSANELTKHREREPIFTLGGDKILKDKTWRADTGVRKRSEVDYPGTIFERKKVTKEFDEYGDILNYKKRVIDGKTVEKEYEGGKLKKKIITKKGKKKTIEYT